MSFLTGHLTNVSGVSLLLPKQKYLGMGASPLLPRQQASGALVDITHISIGPVAGGMKCAIQREKVQPVVKTQLQVLVPKNGTADFVVEMVADQFNLLTCLGADRIIGDQCFFA